ncbi:hypothetical protein [Brevibacillus sp. 179-C9.3 HS]|uniref:hypothetical protein n=1 Tax=unclassified Brevibacillus TaxID=2684853 RepID=UPI00399FD922
MSEQPFWFKVIATVVVVIGILAVLTSVVFIQLLFLAGLIVIFSIQGVFAWQKNRDKAVIIFGVVLLQIVFFVDAINDLFA